MLEILKECGCNAMNNPHLIEKKCQKTFMAYVMGGWWWRRGIVVFGKQIFIGKKFSPALVVSSQSADRMGESMVLQVCVQE